MPNVATIEKTTQDNQQHTSEALLFVDYQLPRIMTRDDLSKAIIYLVQIQQLAKNNNIEVVEFRKQ